MARLRVNHRAVATAAAAAALMVCLAIVMMSDVGNGERILKENDQRTEDLVHKSKQQGVLSKVLHFLWQSGKSSYQHVWPVSPSFIRFLR